MNEEYYECRFLWFIENYSYCWHQNDEELTSPEFTADGLEGTVWTLKLFPRGYDEESVGYISLLLHRSAVDDGPEEFPVDIELSFLAVDGSPLHTIHSDATFEIGDGYGLGEFFSISEMLLHRKFEYLPEDILSVRAVLKVRKGKGSIQSVKGICARTRIGIEQISFRHEVERFSSLKPNEKKTIQIKYANRGHSLSSSLYISEDLCCENKIIVDIKSVNARHILSRCKLYLLEESKKKLLCGEADNRYNATRKDSQKVPLFFTKTDILARKDNLLHNDKLTLLCDCILTTGVEFEKIEETLDEFSFENENNLTKYDGNIFSKKLCKCPSGLDDMKETYSQRLFTDIELKTNTKSFPAHKFVLSARSSVFQAMLTNDMKEKNTDCIQIDDLEDDTVQQLLLFLYSDKLENLQWESAIKLYYAGDKYAIEKLKVMCSSFLVDNLRISNAAELLLLADTHSDSHLKLAVEYFIFKHEKQIFGSNEWMKLIETNAVLVSKTMCQKYTRYM